MIVAFERILRVISRNEAGKESIRLIAGGIGMRLLFRTFFSLVLLMAFLALAPSASACQCPETSLPPPCALFWRSKIVLTALVTRVDQTPDKFGRYPEGTLVHLLVNKLHKGRVAEQVIDVQGQEGDCKTIYRTGHQYLIFASGYDERLNLLKTDMCNGSTEVSHATRQLDYIQKLAQDLTSPSIEGRVLKGRYEPLHKVRILIEGVGKTYRAVTDDKGMYKLDLSEPGQYKVTIVGKFAGGRFSYGDDKGTLTPDGVCYEVVLSQGQCDYREVTVFGFD